MNRMRHKRYGWGGCNNRQLAMFPYAEMQVRLTPHDL